MKPARNIDSIVGNSTDYSRSLPARVSNERSVHAPWLKNVRSDTTPVLVRAPVHETYSHTLFIGLLLLHSVHNVKRKTLHTGSVRVSCQVYIKQSCAPVPRTHGHQNILLERGFCEKLSGGIDRRACCRGGIRRSTLA